MRVDVLIVPGGGIDKYGRLKPTSLQRVDKAVELFKEGVTQYVIFSGAWSFMYTYKPPITEARAMQEYAITHGIPYDKILLDEEACDTIGNAYFPKVRIIKPRGWRNIMVVTSEFHLKRTQYVFEKVFGPDYNLKFIAVTSALPQDVLTHVIDTERKNLELTRRKIGQIPAGDDKAIGEFLFTKHPAYTKYTRIKRAILIHMLRHNRRTF
ncbi:YdcF family protein [candidate division WOR-3 bacterium]|nr:YdcF family protein [candidate division WOR-3 bacterium]